VPNRGTGAVNPKQSRPVVPSALADGYDIAKGTTKYCLASSQVLRSYKCLLGKGGKRGAGLGPRGSRANGSASGTLRSSADDRQASVLCGNDATAIVGSHEQCLRKNMGRELTSSGLSTRAEDATAQIVRIKALHRAKGLQDAQPPIVLRRLPRLERQPVPTLSYRR
jgi:hypothetical protein